MCFDTAVALIKKFEGCVLHPYGDAVGYWTIGYGNRFLLDGTPVTSDTPPLTQAQADRMLEAAVRLVLGRVEEMVTAPCPTDNQIAALTSFAYNEGPRALQDSTLLKLYNSGLVEAAAKQFDGWVYAGSRVLPGLKARRAEEKALFLKEDEPFVETKTV